MNWIEKLLATFRMGTTSATTMQSLGAIEQRAPAVGAKMWCLYVCFCVTFRDRRAVRSRWVNF